MRKFCIAIVILALSSLAATATAQTKAAKPSGGGDKARIEALYQAYVRAFKAKDVNALMANYAPDELFVFDVIPPREYPSWDAYKKDWQGLFGAMPGPIDNNISELDITVVGPVAYARNIQTGYFTGQDGTRLNWAVRVTDVLRKIKGKWLIVQEHVSVPVDFATGKADLMSKP
jgi:ketosteroid isomerase-like protein